MEKKEISGYGEGNYFLGSGNTASCQNSKIWRQQKAGVLKNIRDKLEVCRVF